MFRCSSSAPKVRFGLLALSFIMILTMRVEAADVFTIDRLPVDATGGSAAKAREVALAQGRSKALRQVLQRLSPQDYWGILPRIGEGESVSLVSGIQVSNEKTSATRYLAEVTYSFEARRIHDILRVNQIPFSETQAREAVLLPVLEVADGISLWEEGNIWAIRWKKRSLTNELVPLFLPLGELEDIVSVNVADAVSENWDALGPFAGRYGVGDVVLAQATLQGEEESQTLLIKTVRLSSQNLELGVPRGVGVLVRNRQGLPIEDLIDFGIDQILLRLQESWKRQTIIRSDAVESLLGATVRFEGLREWLAIHNRLSGTPTVSDVEIEALSLTGGKLLVRYVGSVAQLRVAMAQQELNLLETDGLNLIALRESLKPGEEDGFGQTFDGSFEDGGMSEFGNVEVIDIFGAAEKTALDDFPTRRMN